MRSAFRKNNIREIGHTLGRYFAIMLIVALGVGFFAGIKVTKPSMVETFDEYITDYRLFDFRLISTLGLTEEDEKAVAGVEGVSIARGAYSVDFVAEDMSGSPCTLKAMSLTEGINLPELVSGQMPESENECLADAMIFTEDFIGTTIKVNAEDTGDGADSLRCDEYTITGLIRSPLYANLERGTTAVGGGQINGFIFMLPEGFDMEVYTEIYLRLDERADSYSEEYDALVEDMEPKLTEILENRADIRYTTLVSDAEEKIADGRKELEDGKRDYEEAKIDAEKELSEAEKELKKAERELADGRKELADGEKELYEQKDAALSGLSQINDGLSQVNDGLSQIAEAENTLVQINDGIAQAEAGLIQIDAAMAQINAQIPFAQTSEELNALYAQRFELQARRAEMEETLAALKTQKAELEASMPALHAQKAELEATRTELEAQKKTVENGLAEIRRAERDIEDGRQELLEAQQEIADGWEEYYEGKAEAEEEFAEAEADILEAEQELADGEKELRDLEYPDVYVLGRDTNTGYVSFDNDSSIVEGIAEIFPLFFFLVAALVCSTTMTRMVDDQRTQIGTLKALGYSNAAIVWKYTSYSGSAALIGCLGGYFLGTKLFPEAIWTAYRMLYSFADGIVYLFDPWLLIISVVVSLLCSVVATYTACRKGLVKMPAELMRPKTPKAGKRIFLERIPFIWNHMDFFKKVAARNIFRYKKRLFMMLLGIAGCMSLVLAGLGLNDSVKDLVTLQFGGIMKYEYSITFEESMSEEDMAEFKELAGDRIGDSAFYSSGTADLLGDSGAKSASVIASDDEKINSVIDLYMDDTDIPWPADGEVVINTKMAEHINAEVGDEIRLYTDETNYSAVTLSGICENYVGSYVFMTEKTFEQVYDKSADNRSAFAAAGIDSDYHAVAAYLQNECGAGSVSVTEDMKNQVNNMMESLNFIIILVILCAAALAFVVLFNLNNINISERVREIATIKVLGFYPKEVVAYMFRENLVLTAMGAVLGIPLGVALHRFIMDQIQVDFVTFKIEVSLTSFVFAVALTFLFTFMVDLLMRKKLHNVSMSESLKSAE